MRPQIKQELAKRGLEGLSARDLRQRLRLALQETFGVCLPDDWLATRARAEVSTEHIELVRLVSACSSTTARRTSLALGPWACAASASHSSRGTTWGKLLEQHGIRSAVAY